MTKIFLKYNNFKKVGFSLSLLAGFSPQSPLLECALTHLSLSRLSFGDQLPGGYALGWLHIKIVCQKYPIFFYSLVLANVSTELDDRVTVLEENGGGDGNSSVAELEVRVEALEEIAIDHDVRITTAEQSIIGETN